MGIYSSVDKTSPLHLGFGFMIPRPGNLAMVSQSGTMGTIFCSALENIRYFVSSGNEASLILEDYLEYFAQDEQTKAIALFVEGLRGGNRFKDICNETTKKKPIVFLKAGITKEGARAANSHTGSIAGSFDIYKSLFKQTGVIYTDQIEEFLYLAKATQYLLPLPYNDPLRVGIISGGGGFAVHMTDLCERQGFNVVDLRKDPKGSKLIEEISELLPFYWSHNNPIDLVATADFSLEQKITEMMLDSECFDMIFTMTSASFRERVKSMKPVNKYGQRLLKIMVPIVSKQLEGTIEKEIGLCKKYPNKRIIYISFNSSLTNPVFEQYDENEVLVVGNPSIATNVVKKLLDYQKFITSKFESQEKLT
jgi:acyl-CoA synthetase (NDP forming)